MLEDALISSRIPRLVPSSSETTFSVLLERMKRKMQGMSTAALARQTIYSCTGNADHDMHQWQIPNV